ncbi:hypothetical protein [Hymenobacter metallicola]|uniref:Uncharacterized protein n=1 Tax=Hymenobacter metallicola TaxID=2563114 RepID=A0A4Z0QJ99_9BACT|nr:hypothetical protein [Hymenobacter metallicola]TGE29765.1 hypothetical protein E5K02_09985 [Hymenobacter metallicola]
MRLHQAQLLMRAHFPEADRLLFTKGGPTQTLTLLAHGQTLCTAIFSHYALLSFRSDYYDEHEMTAVINEFCFGKTLTLQLAA